jgi:RecA-family ATPase
MGQTSEKAERVRALLNGNNERPEVLLDAVDFLAEPDPDRHWLIEGFIEPERRVLLVGAEGVGKSLLALTAAVQAASGIKVLDRFDVPFPINTLYMDLEMPRDLTRRRLRSLAHTAELQPGALHVLLQPDGLNLLDEEDREQLFAYLQEVQPELIVVDPFYKLSLLGSSKEEDVKPVFGFLDQIRKDFGTAVVLVHHLRKRAQGEASRGKDTSDVYGSALFLRWPETIVVLAEEWLGVAKDRANTFEWVGGFPIKRGGHWPIQIMAPRATAQKADILKYIEENGPCVANDVVRDVPMRREDILKALRLMEIAGLIQRRAGYLEARDPEVAPQLSDSVPDDGNQA